MAYTDISRGVRLAQDYAKYKAWLEQTTEQRQASYAAIVTAANRVKTARASGYIIPFDSTGTGLIYIVEEFTFDLTKIGALTSPNLLDSVKDFKPAKLTVIQRVQTATAKESSRITGRKYYRHENDSVTANFGKKVAADTYESVTTAIKEKTAFKALFTGSENATASKFRFVPEGV
jgi:hypothetical protein